MTPARSSVEAEAEDLGKKAPNLVFRQGLSGELI
jgi:hypothetical protein